MKRLIHLAMLTVLAGTTMASGQEPFGPPMPPPEPPPGAFLPPGMPPPGGPGGPEVRTPFDAHMPAVAFNAFENGANPPVMGTNWMNRSYILVDFLVVNTYLNRNPAYTRQTAGGTVVTESFGYDGGVLAPRITFAATLSPDVTGRASWMRFRRSSQVLSTFNADPNTTVASMPLFNGDLTVTQSDQIVLGGTFLKNQVNTFTTTSNFQVLSPSPYWFVNQVPTQSLDDNPPNPLPPFTLFNSVQAGYPDTLTFASAVLSETYDLELTKALDFGSTSGMFVFGMRYGRIVHNYNATRVNAGGFANIPGYDPFRTQVQDATIITHIDRESIEYQHSFNGAGPKFGFELSKEFGSFTRFYTKGNLSTLFGNRKESARYSADQFIQITDTTLQGGQPQGDIFYRQTAQPQTALRQRFSVIPVGEGELGVEFSLNTRFSPIIRLGVFGQWWGSGGNATNPNANYIVYGGNVSVGLEF